MKFATEPRTAAKRIAAPTASAKKPAALKRPAPIRTAAALPGKRVGPGAGPGRRVGPPTAPRGRALGLAKQGRKTAGQRVKGQHPGSTIPTRKSGGFDPGKFAGEVAGNFGKGVGAAQKGIGDTLNSLPGVGDLRKRSGSIPTGAQSARNNQALKNAVGKK